MDQSPEDVMENRIREINTYFDNKEISMICECDSNKFRVGIISKIKKDILNR